MAVLQLPAGGRTTLTQDIHGKRRQLCQYEDTAISYLYKAFGEQSAVSGSYTNPFTWVGKLGYYRQPDLGNYWLRARVYDPQRGRFVSRDPVRQVNLYRWPGNTPVGRVDPSGLGLSGWLAYVRAEKVGLGVPCTKASGSLGTGVRLEEDKDWACEAMVPHGPGWNVGAAFCSCPDECTVEVEKEAVSGPREGEIVYARARKGRCVWTGPPVMRAWRPGPCEKNRPTFRDCRKCGMFDCRSCCERASGAWGWSELTNIRCVEMCVGKLPTPELHAPHTPEEPPGIEPPGGWSGMRGPVVHRFPRK